MRNYLLAGASALALTLSAGAAFADTAPGKFDIKISGDAFVEGGFVGTDRDVSSRTFSLLERFRLNVMPQATADNGLTYGARARIRANSSAATIDGDRSYVFVKGNFGEFWGGTADGVSSEFYAGSLTWDWQVLANNDEWKRLLPNGTVNSGAGTYGTFTNLGWGQWGGPGVNGVQLLQSNSVANRINYWTPRWSGFQGGLTYTPKLGSALTGVDRSALNGAAVGTTTNAQQTTNFQDLYELTINYVNKFENGFGVKGIVGYTGGSAASDAVGLTGYNDLESFNVAARLSYYNFELGGSYVYGGKSGYTKASYVAAGAGPATATVATAATGVRTKLSDQDSWTVGGQYTWGPIIFGLSYQEQTDAGNVAVAGERSLDFINAGITYNVAPGLQAAIEYTHFENKSDIASTTTVPTKDAGNIVLVRSIVKF